MDVDSVITAIAKWCCSSLPAQRRPNATSRHAFRWAHKGPPERRAHRVPLLREGGRTWLPRRRPRRSPRRRRPRRRSKSLQALL